MTFYDEIEQFGELSAYCGIGQRGNAVACLAAQTPHYVESVVYSTVIACESLYSADFFVGQFTSFEERHDFTASLTLTRKGMEQRQ